MVEQGSVYAAFIEAELKGEQERRVALTASATSVVTSSSAFIALLAAVLVFVTGKDYEFSDSGSRGLLLSLASFVIAALLALLATGSREYSVASSGTLALMLDEHWKDHEVDARNTCASLNVKSLTSLRTGSNKKAGLLVISLVFQIAAALGLVASIGWELRDRLW